MEFDKPLFKTLNVCGVNYVLINGSDYDLYVSSCDRQEFENILSRFGYYKSRKIAGTPGHHLYVNVKKPLLFNVKYSLEFYRHEKIYIYKNGEDVFLDKKLDKSIYRPSDLGSILLYLGNLVYYKNGNILRDDIQKLIHYLKAFNLERKHPNTFKKFVSIN